jgi:hypothetical protein
MILRDNKMHAHNLLEEKSRNDTECLRGLDLDLSMTKQNTIRFATLFPQLANENYIRSPWRQKPNVSKEIHTILHLNTKSSSLIRFYKLH